MGEFSLKEIDRQIKEKKKMEHKEFVKSREKDLAFQQFVQDVSPRNARGQQPVFFAELFLVLKILWEIYSIMKQLGFFSKWWTMYKVKRAMKISHIPERERVLQAIVDGL